MKFKFCSKCGTYYSQTCRCRFKRNVVAEAQEEMPEPIMILIFNRFWFIEGCRNGKRHPEFCQRCDIENCLKNEIGQFYKKMSEKGQKVLKVYPKSDYIGLDNEAEK